MSLSCPSKFIGVVLKGAPVHVKHPGSRAILNMVSPHFDLDKNRGELLAPNLSVRSYHHRVAGVFQCDLLRNKNLQFHTIGGLA